MADPAADVVQQIAAVAAGSDAIHFEWMNRGLAPKGYVKGMAVMFARDYCKLRAGDPAAIEMTKADTGATDVDALSFYSDKFAEAGLGDPGDDTAVLRQLFVLLTGLGMRESSGQYCEGRDTSASNETAETAEAGLFQVSFNSITASPIMAALFDAYAGKTDFIDIFKEGVHCSSAQLQNWGTGKGADFQALTKACPAFAVEYAAVGLRNVRHHWGPINRKQAQVRPEYDELFQSVQQFIDDGGITSV